MIEKKLAKWKTLYLSMESRLTFMNSVLDALLTYMMPLFFIPTGEVEEEILVAGNKEKKSSPLYDDWQEEWKDGDKESETSKQGSLYEVGMEVYKQEVEAMEESD